MEKGKVKRVIEDCEDTENKDDSPKNGLNKSNLASCRLL